MKKDLGLKANKITGEKLAQLKQQRRTYNAKQKAIRDKASSQRTTKRNIGTLSKEDQLKLERQRQKALKARKKLKYKKSGGDVAYKNFMSKNQYHSNFYAFYSS